MCGTVTLKEVLAGLVVGIISRMCRPCSRKVVCICPHTQLTHSQFAQNVKRLAKEQAEQRP